MANTDLRNTLRSATVGSKKEFKRTQVEYAGHTFEFIQPTLRERKDIVNKCISDTGNIDPITLQVEAVINLTVIPDTTERVFDSADREDMYGRPTGSFIDVFAEKAVEILTGSKDGDVGEKKT